MAHYTKNVSEPWFSLIKSGKKSVEGRLNKGDFALMKVGDTVTWTNENRSVNTKIVFIHKYNSFEAYLKKETLKRALPNNANTIKKGCAIYHQYYSPADEKKMGILAIGLKVIN